MKKTILILTMAIMVMALAAGSTLAGMDKCTVTEIQENLVVLDCGRKAAGFKADDKVKIKKIIKKIRSESLEGC